MQGVAGDCEGIVPRSVKMLYQLIGEQKQKKCTVSVSFFQLYKDKIYDLLNSSHNKRLTDDSPGLKLKLVNDVFTVQNLFSFECKTA